MKHITNQISMLFACCSISLLIACGPGETQPECDFNFTKWCYGAISFSIVNRDTYENLVGEGRQIDPDKIVVTNTRTDTMHIDPLLFSDGWVTIEEFNPFDEIECFDQCKSDSAFTRTYYLNYGGADTDTMEIYFAERDDDPVVTYNKSSGDVPNNIADSLGDGRSLYWFLKEIN